MNIVLRVNTSLFPTLISFAILVTSMFMVYLNYYIHPNIILLISLTYILALT